MIAGERQQKKVYLVNIARIGTMIKSNKITSNDWASFCLPKLNHIGLDNSVKALHYKQLREFHLF